MNRIVILLTLLSACHPPTSAPVSTGSASSTLTPRCNAFIGPGFVHNDRDTLARLGVGAAAGETAIYDGSKFVALQPQNDYAGKHFEWTDEFVYGNTNTSTFGTWQRIATGTGTSSVNVTGTVTGSHFGIVGLATGSTATGSVVLYEDLGVIDLDALPTVTQETTVGMTTLSSATDEFEDFIGVADTTNSINLTNGCGFLYDRGNVATGGPNTTNLGDWECVCAASGVRTMYVMNGSTVSDESFTTHAAPVETITFPNSAGWTTLKLVITPGVRAEFYVAEGSGYVKSCDIATNLPRVVGPVIYHTKSAGTASLSLFLDRHRLAIDLPAARSL